MVKIEKIAWLRQSYQMLKKQEGLNHAGKGTVTFVTLYVIQTFFLLIPAVKHLKFKVRYLTVTLRG